MLLVNKAHPLPPDYIPPDLVPVCVPFAHPGIDERNYLRLPAAHALERLFCHAHSQHIILTALSGYRSYARQKQLYDASVAANGPEHAAAYLARPGTSEHQTGLAIDISSLEESFSETPEGIWLQENAPRNGFILRYPKDKTHLTGYAFEPWHFRYIGPACAQYLSAKKWTLEEYLSAFISQKNRV